eukprot:Skav215250  [mRNA]  locus=scaffold811:258487:260790:- [translate_table: standard]
MRDCAPACTICSEDSKEDSKDKKDEKQDEKKAIPEAKKEKKALCNYGRPVQRCSCEAAAQQEERRTGAVSWRVYAAYAKACGGVPAVGTFLIAVAISEVPAVSASPRNGGPWVYCRAPGTSRTAGWRSGAAREEVLMGSASMRWQRSFASSLGSCTRPRVSWWDRGGPGPSIAIKESCEDVKM